MHSRSNNIKFTSYNDANGVVDELSESLHSRYQGNLQTTMRGSDFIFDPIQLMCCKCHTLNFKRGSSYIDSPAWIIEEKATINPKNMDDKCFKLLRN